MQIKTFDDISRIHKIEKDTLDGIKNRLARSMGIKTDKVKFTGLQKAAFNTEGFWLSEKINSHIIVQGATSAGKTLISEMAILDTLKNNDKCIVLVPLRAMVRERWEHLKKDLEFQGDERRIYASSSDYQDHDGEIMDGDYTVAIIVYEKFFTMLSQKSDKMLKDCALLVVDELQMLSNANRGPKLEIAIQKVLQRNRTGNVGNDTRIMCLTTSDISVEYIKRWLTVDGRPPIPIVYDKRPTTLHEHVIRLDGKFKCRTTFGEDDRTGTEPLDEEGDFGFSESVEKSRKPEVKKRHLLKNLLQKIYADNPAAKVLIFVNGRRRTKNLAEFIADENILPSEKLTGIFTEVDDYDGDDYQRLFKNKLFPQRIACHNAAISTALREFVERLFSDETDPLKLVVATETLTIGMNMPVDVMILFDHEIRRGENTQDLTSQEYKNFVGRAGRLGQKNIDGGRSYIVASDIDEARKFWDKYVNCRQEEIKSALIGADEKNQAPYYLSLLDVDRYKGEGYSTEDLEKLWDESFSKNCGGKRIDPKKICRELTKANLCEETDDDDERYELTGFGVGMAPYAFSPNTCKIIDRYFFNGGCLKGEETPQEGKGGLPETITKKDLDENRFLTDMLYILCSTPEIRQMGQLRLPPSTDVDRARPAMERVEKVLKKILDEKKYEPWPKSALKHMCDKDHWGAQEHRTKENILRAILLWYWTQGWRIEKIRQEIKVPQVEVVSGDLARLAETVSYQIESIRNCYGPYKGSSKFAESSLLAIRKLSLRVNYGVPQNLVNIANRHVHALDRKIILDIGELYEELSGEYDNPLQMLRTPTTETLPKIQKILDDDLREQILQSANDANTHETFDNLLKSMEDEQPDYGTFGEAEKAALTDFYNAKSPDNEDETILNHLEKIFPMDETPSETRLFKNVELEFPLADSNFAKLSAKDQTFFLIVHNDDFNVKDYKYQMRKFDDGNSRLILLNFVADESSALEVGANGTLTLKVDGEAVLENINLSMKCSTFAGLVAQTLKLGYSDASPLLALLWDTCGVFDRPLSSFNSLLRNYLPEVKNNATPNVKPVRVLWDKRKSAAVRDLAAALVQNEIPYRELSWGKQLFEEREIDEPTLIFLDWGVVQSCRSLNHFCNGLDKAEYRHVYAVFDSEESFCRWGGDPCEPRENLAHCTSTKNFDEDISSFKLLLESWRAEKFLIGVSYAHEKVMDTERLGVTLLKKFVDILKKELSEQILFFDKAQEHHFHGNAVKSKTLGKYAQCEYFIVLDDEYYDKSNACNAEAQTIRETLATLGNPAGHLWLLHVNGQKHCKLYKPENGDYVSLISEDNAETLAREFVKSIRSKA